MDPGGDRNFSDSFLGYLSLDLFKKPDEMLLSQHFAATVRSAGRQLGQAAFTLACLPYEAFFSLDAIVRTAWRMLGHTQTTSGVESVE